MKRPLIPALIGLVLALALGGCGPKTNSPIAMSPMVPTQQYTEPEQIYANPGSLFNAAENGDLYADNRARRVGDIITIKIVETSKSKSKADTTSTKDSEINLGVNAFFGRNTLSPLIGVGPFKGDIGVDPMVSAQTQSSLKATGETKRENYVTATIGARVLQVLPGGVLELGAMREIKVNEETQVMVVRGLVNSRDVASDNSVESTQLAESKVEYYGHGQLSDMQKQGWLTRLLNNIWPI